MTTPDDPVEVAARATYEVDFGPRTVWVNSNMGICVARFGRQGAEIHKDFAEQMASGSECLICEHGMTDAAAWERWCARVWTYFGVVIEPITKPSWITP